MPAFNETTIAGDAGVSPAFKETTNAGDAGVSPAFKETTIAEDAGVSPVFNETKSLPCMAIQITVQPSSKARRGYKYESL